MRQLTSDDLTVALPGIISIISGLGYKNKNKKAYHRGLPSADQDHQAELRQAEKPSTQSSLVRVVGMPGLSFRQQTLTIARTRLQPEP